MMWVMTDLGIPGVGDALLIASGSSALVYEALSGTGERLAVKVLRGISGTEATRRFEREVSAAERLKGHPNIMRVHDTGVTAADEPYLVMALVAAGSLSDELERKGAFSLQQATGDVAIAADALEFAHQRGVLHRDIKPGNLLRSDDGGVILTDFGIARVVDAGITSATVGASTPLYAAPEILAENMASVRSEVYALGALLYALLAGRAAFADSDNLWAAMDRIRTETPSPIIGVPAPVMRVIDQAMAKHPADRPSSAKQFRENLRMALTATETWEPPPATVELAPDDAVLGPSLRGEASVPIVTIRRGQPASLQHPTDPGQTLRQPAPSGLAPTDLAPPAPPRHRPAPAAGAAPGSDSATAKILCGAAVLILVAALAWWATSQLLTRDQAGDAAILPPIDNSLPSPDTSDGDRVDGDNDPPADQDDNLSIDDLPTSPQIPDTFVSFTGDHYSALFPEGWALAASDVEETYGFRSMFVNDSMYLNIDTTPKDQRTPGGDIAQSARDIAAGIGSASEVRSEDIGGLTMHSFTFRNQQGVDSIDIFFEVDGDGYAVVAGSASDPNTAFATARLVALSIRSNPT
jgi:serine/threonine protein kinase